MSEQELKSCPFCGGTAILESTDIPEEERTLITTDDNKLYYVYCDDCLSGTVGFLAESEAAEAWNRRTDDKTK